LFILEDIFPFRFTGTVCIQKCTNEILIAIKGIIPDPFYDLIIAFPAIMGSAMLPAPQWIACNIHRGIGKD
jgi:hypothetical protein